jgi:hypothetical protein
MQIRCQFLELHLSFVESVGCVSIATRLSGLCRSQAAQRSTRGLGNRTSAVRLPSPPAGALLAALLLTLLVPGPAGAGGPARAARAEGALGAGADGAWLTLEQDQRAARARAAPLRPPEAGALESRERQERARLGALLGRQGWEREALGRAGRGGGPAAQPAWRLRALELRQGQERDAERLRRRLARPDPGLAVHPIGPPAVPAPRLGAEPFSLGIIPPLRSRQGPIR